MDDGKCHKGDYRGAEMESTGAMSNEIWEGIFEQLSFELTIQG